MTHNLVLRTQYYGEIGLLRHSIEVEDRWAVSCMMEIYALVAHKVEFCPEPYGRKESGFLSTTRAKDWQYRLLQLDDPYEWQRVLLEIHWCLIRLERSPLALEEQWRTQNFSTRYEECLLKHMYIEVSKDFGYSLVKAWRIKVEDVTTVMLNSSDLKTMLKDRALTRDLEACLKMYASVITRMIASKVDNTDGVHCPVSEINIICQKIKSIKCPENSNLTMRRQLEKIMRLIAPQK